MKLTAALLIFTALQVFAGATYSQFASLTLDVNNTTVAEVLKAIENESEFYFLYSPKMIDVERNVSLKVENENINSILDQLFKETDVRYMIRDRQIVLTTQERLKLLDPHRQQGVITGKIIDQSSIPMIGVTVSIKGTTKGTISDAQGNYSIAVSPEDILVYSFVGMRTQEIPVTGKTQIDVTMEAVTIDIEEVVAVGYGTQKKINITGAVDVITSEQIQNRPSPTVSQLLQGQVPGLDFSAGIAGFEPGANLSLNIRGIGSLNGGSPYVVIDGYPGDMNRINPEDIESISILKDAAASAIYGARAPYGVILIITKKGNKSQKLTATYNGSVYIETPQRLPEMPDSYTFARVFNEASANRGGTHRFTDAAVDNIIAYQNQDWDFIRQALDLPSDVDPIYGTPPSSAGGWRGTNNGFANIDWFDVHFGHSVNQKHNFSIQGGSERTSYYFSTGYLSEGSVLNYGRDKFNRINVLARVNTAIAKWWDFSYETRFMKSVRDYPNLNLPIGNNDAYVILFHWIARNYPTTSMYNGYGTIHTSSQIPLIRDGGNDKLTTSENWQTFSTELRPAKGWKINGDFAYQLEDRVLNHVQNTFYYEAVDRTLVPTGGTEPNSIENRQSSNYYWTGNVYTSYELNLAESNNFLLLAGMQYEYDDKTWLTASKTNMLVQSVPSLQTAIGDVVASESLTHWSTAGYFGRFAYNFKEKYLLESNVRYDGTSKFRESNRWGFFPSFSAGWVVSKENFWKGLSPYINYLKFRGSWGSLGNQNVAPYQDLELIPLISTQLNWLFNFGATRPVGYTGTPTLVSPALTWETATTKNIGVNMGFLDQRLQFDLDLYERLTTEMIGPAESRPGVLGASVPNSNNSTLRTRGWETQLRWKQSLINGLYYFVNLNLYDSRSVVTKYNNPNQLLSNWYEGKEVGTIWGYTTDGLFKTQEEVEAHLAEVDQSFFYGTWRPGDVRYMDLNGDGMVDQGAYTLEDHGDLTIIGNSMPHYQYGVFAGFSFKGLDFSMLWKGTAKSDLYFDPDDNFYWGFYTNGQSSIFTNHLDYFRDREGTKYEGLHMGQENINLDSKWPKPYTSSSENAKNRQRSTLALANGSYLRLQNVQLGYNLPLRITSKVGITKTRVYFSGDNLLTLTKLPPGIDPVAPIGYRGQSGKTWGANRVFSFGLTITY